MPAAREVLAAGVVGTFLFLGGNGLTVWAQTRVPSGLTAVLVGFVPLWLVLLSWAVEGDRPPPRRMLGLLLGTVGVAGLVGLPSGRLDPLGVGAILLGGVLWATGSMLARRLTLPRSVAWATAAQLAVGTVWLALAATISGQWSAVRWAEVDLRVLASFTWLVAGGSIAGLVAYNWLLRNASPALATTYAYVNPLVAVWLGWLLGGEVLAPAELLCSAAIVGAVALVVQPPARARRAPADPRGSSATG